MGKQSKRSVAAFGREKSTTSETFRQINGRRHRLVMSGRRLPKCPASASKDFSSTPVKTGQRQDFRTAKGSDDDDGVLSDDEDTFSLLSPIYHDSFDSDDDPELSPAPQDSPRHSDNSRLSVSPVRCELPRTPSSQMLNAAVEAAGSPTLSAWEVWLVNKAKEDRRRLEKRAEEERILKEKKEQEERLREEKKMVMEEKIQVWLNMKREQEKHEQLVKQSKEEEELYRQQEKQRETERKAQEKYNNWLQKKNQEKIDAEKREKEEAALKEEQEKERRRRAQEKFKEWLSKANEKSRSSPRSPCYQTGPYDKSYPSPSFYNPIPWKPIHVPPPETSLNKTSGKKPQRQGKCQQRPGTASRLRNSASAGPSLQRR